MKLISMLLLLLLFGCTDYEQLAARICIDKDGVKGYQVRWGFNVVVCNNGHREILD